MKDMFGCERQPEKVTSHFCLLVEAGLLKAEDISTFDETDYSSIELLWADHEYLDAARDPSRREQAKKDCRESRRVDFN